MASLETFTSDPLLEVKLCKSDLNVYASPVEQSHPLSGNHNARSGFPHSLTHPFTGFYFQAVSCWGQFSGLLNPTPNLAALVTEQICDLKEPTHTSQCEQKKAPCPLQAWHFKGNSARHSPGPAPLCYLLAHVPANPALCHPRRLSPVTSRRRDHTIGVNPAESSRLLETKHPET